MRASARLSIAPLSERDLELYDRLLPNDSLLLRLLHVIPWQRFETKLRGYYAATTVGQPEYCALRLLKLELLAYLYRLSRARTIERAACDLHWKFFLGLPVDAVMPDESTLFYFRKRLGTEGFTELLDELVGVARDAGVLGHSLRIKDATHVVADIATPTAIGLFSQLRRRLIAAIGPIDPAVAAQFEADAEAMAARDRLEGSSDAERLAARVEIVRDLRSWIETFFGDDHNDNDNDQGPDDPARRQLRRAGDLAGKILHDLDHPGGGDRTLSVVDPDARCGFHHGFYDGYLLDVLVDADSEIVTAVGTLPANGHEAADAVKLIAHEEAAAGERGSAVDIEALSIDAIGFDGPVLDQLHDVRGLGVEVYVPVRDFEGVGEGYGADRFEVIGDGDRLRCPGGHLSGGPQQAGAGKPHEVRYQFAVAGCRGCVLRSACDPAGFARVGSRGRRVRINLHAAAYERARSVASSEAYAEVRSRHPLVERKLGEMVRHHGGRRARHRGIGAVGIEHVMLAMAVNLKRLAKLLVGAGRWQRPEMAGAAAGAV